MGLASLAQHWQRGLVISILANGSPPIMLVRLSMFPPKWTALRAGLDKPSPPTAETRTLMPNETWLVDASVGVTVPVDPKRDISSVNKESLEVIRRLSPIWFRVTCEVWPWNLEGMGPSREKLEFGHKLQGRWHQFGLLWLDEVNSEPMKLDLKVQATK